MTSTWRQKQQQKQWTKPLDISYIFQLQTIAERLKKHATEKDDKKLLELAGQIRFIVARVNGEELNVPLSQHWMPEDTQAKIPDPRKQIELPLKRRP